MSISTCVMVERAVAFFYSVTVVSTSLLFFFRTRALFGTHPWVVAFFAFLWLAVLGGSLAYFVNILGPTPVDPTTNTPTCLKPGMKPFVGATTIICMINDTFVFLAISWRLSRISYNRHVSTHVFNSGIRFLIFGDYLPVFSKVLLKDGQAYYLLAFFLIFVVCFKNSSQICSFHRTIVTMNIISVTMLYYPSNSAILQTIIAVPNIALMNIMTSWVFRNTILYADWRESQISTSIVFQDIDN